MEYYQVSFYSEYYKRDVWFEIDEKNAEVDLTEELRESIILALPTYPVCSETCPGVERKDEMPSDDRWNVLDNLNKK